MALRSPVRPGTARAPLTAHDLERAIRAGEMVLHYQPKVDLRTHQVVAVEALVRWQRGPGDMVYPDQFIPVIEESGLMPALTAAVLDQALDQHVRWRAAGLHIKVAINAAATLLSDPRSVPRVARSLAERSVSPAALTVEVTESVVMTDLDAAMRTLHSLNHMGVTLSIDDFGTGYSSLSYLSRLPVHELKIDRSFVTTLPTDENHQAIVRSTVGLGHAFGHRVVAEGVEDLATYLLLQRSGCDLAQGYFISRPADAPSLTDWMHREWPGRARQLAEAARADDRPPAGEGAPEDDWVAAAARLRAYEQIVVAGSDGVLTGALRDYVVACGGRVLGPDDTDDDDLLPIDISLGSGAPTLPAAPDGSRARRQLDRTLPQLVEAARRVATLLRGQGNQGRWT